MQSRLPRHGAVAGETTREIEVLIVLFLPLQTSPNTPAVLAASPSAPQLEHIRLLMIDLVAAMASRQSHRPQLIYWKKLSQCRRPLLQIQAWSLANAAERYSRSQHRRTISENGRNPLPQLRRLLTKMKILHLRRHEATLSLQLGTSQRCLPP